MVEGPKVDEVTPQEAVDRHEQGAVLLDVREDDEWAAGHAPINRAGPTEVDLSPPEPVDPVEIRRRIHAGEWVVDLRSRTAFARGHLAGTVNLEVGDSFATFADLADARYDADMVVLDVRRDDEWVAAAKHDALGVGIGG